MRQQLRAALRTASHEGPPRLPGPLRRRRTAGSPLAHLETRRHRDPDRPAPHL